MGGGGRIEKSYVKGQMATSCDIFFKCVGDQVPGNKRERIDQEIRKNTHSHIHTYTIIYMRVECPRFVLFVSGCFLFLFYV